MKITDIFEKIKYFWEIMGKPDCDYNNLTPDEAKVLETIVKVGAGKQVGNGKFIDTAIVNEEAAREAAEENAQGNKYPNKTLGDA